MHLIELKQHFNASMTVAFKAITNQAGTQHWLDGIDVTIVRKGIPSPNGLGCVRLVHVRTSTFIEEVVYWQEPRAVSYRLTGSALHNYIAEVWLHPAPRGGADLQYRIRFTIPWYFGGTLLGSLVTRRLARNLQMGLLQLASQLRHLSRDV